MSMIVSNCQDCNEQQCQTLSCVHYTIFSVVKLDVFKQALLLDRILALGKPRVRLAYILFCNTFEIWWLNQSSTVRKQIVCLIVVTECC